MNMLEQIASELNYQRTRAYMGLPNMLDIILYWDLADWAEYLKPQDNNIFQAREDYME